MSPFGKKFDIEIKVYLMEIMLLCVIANILDLGQEFQFEENVFQLSGEIRITKQVITSWVHIRKLPYSSVQVSTIYSLKPNNLNNETAARKKVTEVPDSEADKKRH